MSIYVVAHFVIAFMCIVSYLMHTVFGKTGLTPFRVFLVLGIALAPALNTIFTLWCLIYLIHEVLTDLVDKVSEINKKVFRYDSILAT